jgi:branched-chain amino acid transport system ATP-binding protein
VVQISLECINVSKNFGSLRALHDVTFKLREGQINGLIGPNGSGKSVLINCISGVPYYPDKGEIKFFDKNIENLKPSERCRLGIARTFQNITYFPSLTVKQNISIGNFSTETEEKFTDYALKTTDLWEKQDYIASELSVFELKSLMIAQCLGMNPKLILIDEPLGGLSEEEAIKTIEFIRNINKNGITLLVIEHKIRELIDCCDKMFVLQLGQKIAEGNPEEIINNEKVINAYFGEKMYA